MKKNLRILFAICFAMLTSALTAQNCFTTGTGVDGAYVATTNITLAGGTYNFTTFTIDPGVTVNVTGTQPLIIYCSGVVTINGILSAQGGNGANGVTYTSGGTGGVGVAGGGNGGSGSFSSTLGPITGSSGFGAGGVNTQGAGWSGGGGAGYSSTGNSSGGVGGFGGPIYGTADIAAMDAGSGGGGGSGGYDCGAGGGGAGGGIISITSGISITIAPTVGINVAGGNGGSDGTGNCGGGAGGSGGSIILRSPTITLNGLLGALGGTGGTSTLIGAPYFGVGATGANGRIRLDYNGTLLGTGMTMPAVGYHVGVPTSVLAATATSNNIICNGANDGTATAAPTGGVPNYTYAWSPSGGTAATASGLGVGTYTCTITDALGCTTTTSVSITEPSQIQVTGSTINPSCFASCDGMINTSVSGGVGPYTYMWSPNGSTAPMITGLCNGCYTLVVTDAVGCQSNNVICVTEPTTAVSATVSSTDVSCNGVCDGTATLSNISGGTGPYSYFWCNAATTTSVSNLCPGMCVVSITDANGCPFSDTITINEPAPASVNVLGSDTIICDPYVLQLCTQGTFMSYMWSNGDTSACTTSDTTECLSVILVDALGCVSVDTVCVIDDICTGITSQNGMTIGIVPNPTSGIVRIMHGNAEPQLVEVFDAQGKKCASSMLANNSEMNLSNLPQGVYSVRVDGKVHRLVISR